MTRRGIYQGLHGSPFEIYDVSTASYSRKVSSTYQIYACGTFLLYFLYLHRLFQKADGRGKRWRGGQPLRAATLAVNHQRISTATDGGGFSQPRVFR